MYINITPAAKYYIQTQFQNLNVLEKAFKMIGCLTGEFNRSAVNNKLSHLQDEQIDTVLTLLLYSEDEDRLTPSEAYALRCTVHGFETCLYYTEISQAILKELQVKPYPFTT